ncbi:hypothetical protein EZMO1_1479 [Endozoicomonas montiporae CL-33]|uniref:Uncharacterized protein n=1 Tax=Endozoicomonas montiporae CL-33 TaxID=570277 RepID=A0A142BA71_9GAMM|nr:hypothetical protein EZMO1_1479 [Endozoicomonas montiporae CL-33]
MFKAHSFSLIASSGEKDRRRQKGKMPIFQCVMTSSGRLENLKNILSSSASSGHPPKLLKNTQTLKNKGFSDSSGSTSGFPPICLSPYEPLPPFRVVFPFRGNHRRKARAGGQA